MTQEMYDLICKVLQGGAPALANDLIAALNKLITDYQTLKETIPEAAEPKKVEEKK